MLFLHQFWGNRGKTFHHHSDILTFFPHDSSQCSSSNNHHNMHRIFPSECHDSWSWITFLSYQYNLSGSTPVAIYPQVLMQACSSSYAPPASVTEQRGKMLRANWDTHTPTSTKQWSPPQQTCLQDLGAATKHCTSKAIQKYHHHQYTQHSLQIIGSYHS